MAFDTTSQTNQQAQQIEPQANLKKPMPNLSGLGPAAMTSFRNGTAAGQDMSWMAKPGVVSPEYMSQGSQDNIQQVPEGSSFQKLYSRQPQDQPTQQNQFASAPGNTATGTMKAGMGAQGEVQSGLPSLGDGSGFPSIKDSSSPDVAPPIPEIPKVPLSTAPDPRSGALYDQLLQRSKQSLNIDPNDPVIKNQVDASHAQGERAGNSYLTRLAEQAGPYSNIGAQTRSVAEKLGQSDSALQASLMGSELTNKRNEIQSALQGMGSQLSSEQQQELQRQLGLTNAALSKYQVQGNLGLGNRQLANTEQQTNNSLGLGLINANLGQQGVTNQNQQFYSGLSQQDRQFLNNLALQYAGLNQQGDLSQQQIGLDQQRINSGNDQFNAQLGLNTSDRASYWDAIRSGLIGG